MSKFLAKMVQADGSMTVVIDGSPYTVSASHPHYNLLREAVRNNDSDAFLKNVDVVAAVEVAVNENPAMAGKVEVRGSDVYYNGNPLHNSLSKRIMDLVRGNFDVAHMLKFLENLMQNPSKNSVDQLYAFLEKEAIPITEDGCFIGYKTVKKDYFDKYSGKFSNKPGALIECPRNEVDDNPANHCSKGFHVGGLAYSGPGGWYNSSGDKVVLVKVNPRDCVSVPSDHNHTKLRVHRYEVIGDFKTALNKPLYSGKGVNDTDYNNDEYVSDDSWNDDEARVAYWDELQEGDVVTFKYNKNGKTTQRYLEVTEVDFIDDLVSGTLVFPEENHGEYRSFHVGQMDGLEFYND